MENLTIEYLLLALLGMIIHISMKVISRKNKNEPISVSRFLRNPINWVRIILTVASTFAVIIMMDDIAKTMGINLENGDAAKGIVSFLAGYSNHSLIRNLLQVFKKK